MKRILAIAAAIIAVVLIGNVLIASAQGGNRPWPRGNTCPNGYTCPFSGTLPFQGVPGGMMGGRGMMGGQMYADVMGANGMHEQVWTAVAKKLGMTYDELTKALQNGQTVAQLAQAKGVSPNDLAAAALDGMKTALADLVKQGVMTQQQADWMLDRMDDMPMFNFGQGLGPGIMGGSRSGMMRGWAQPAGPQG